MSLSELAATFAAAKQKMMEDGQAAIKAEFSQVFKNHPELTCIKWTQYCPYFNDGDSCTFSVHEFYISNAIDIENVDHYGEYDAGCEEDEDGEAVNVFVYGSWQDKAKKYSDIWEIEKFANSELGSDIFEDCFGDGVVVTVTPTDIQIDDHDHD